VVCVCQNNQIWLTSHSILRKLFVVEHSSQECPEIFHPKRWETGSGKSNLAKILVRRLLEKKVRIFVFDPSEAWTLTGPIKRVIEIPRPIPIEIEIPRTSCVFDIKTLYVSEQQLIVQRFCQKLYNRTISSEEKKRIPTLLVFEESQVYLPEGRLKGKAFEEVTRILNIGRNYKLRIMILTQFAANVDKKAVKPCRQKFIGYTDEPNDLEYLKGWVRGRLRTLEELDVGQFFYRCGKVLRMVKVPLFDDNSKPKKVRLPHPRIPVEVQVKQRYGWLIRKESNKKFLYGLAYGLIISFLVLLRYLLSLLP